jgi:hypothetical protein
LFEDTKSTADLAAVGSGMEATVVFEKSRREFRSSPASSVKDAYFPLMEWMVATPAVSDVTLYFDGTIRED